MIDIDYVTGTNVLGYERSVENRDFRDLFRPRTVLELRSAAIEQDIHGGFSRRAEGLAPDDERRVRRLQRPQDRAQRGLAEPVRAEDQRVLSELGIRRRGGTPEPADSLDGDDLPEHDTTSY